jgi:hypothetical protein
MAVGEWDQRQLCPDGGCVGLIGPDGTCKVCGRVAPGWGDERRRGLVPADVASDDDKRGKADDADQDEILPSAPAMLGEAVEWHRRRLCSDGACIGVIGPDGRCKICGKPASGEEQEEEEDDDDDEDYGENDSLAFPEESDLHSRDEIEDDEEDGDEEHGGDDDDEDGGDGDDDDEPEITISHGEAEPDIVIVRAAAAPDSGGAGDLDDRKLCPDGACIGVIGPDGRCKICGKEAA